MTDFWCARGNGTEAVPYGKTCRAVGLRPPPTIHGGYRDDREGRPYAEIAKIAPRREPGGFVGYLGVISLLIAYLL